MTQFQLFQDPIKPWIKWPGGKSLELPQIAARAPAEISGRYLDPFVGGGSVLLATNPRVPAFVNDLCPELIALYQAGTSPNTELSERLFDLAWAWDQLSTFDELWTRMASKAFSNSPSNEIAIDIRSAVSEAIQERTGHLFPEFVRRLERDLPKKLKRIGVLQDRLDRILPLQELADNIEGSVRSSFYMSVRARYNGLRLDRSEPEARADSFFFLREFSYASMFRFNGRGEFNVPYGGIAYNRKSFASKVDNLFSKRTTQRLVNSEFSCLDFEDFIIAACPDAGDFLFVDPPYDSDFSDYDNRAFTRNDQGRLESILRSMSCPVMVVIGGSDFIRELYSRPPWRILEDPITYRWTIKSRNDRSATHLTVCNYL